MAETGSNSGRNNHTFALETQQKVELYFLALIFTVAGLAIQSARFSDNRWQWALEIAGWSCLVTAGIVALVRMQHVPRVFYYAHEALAERRRLSEVKQEPEQSNIQFEDAVIAQPLAVEKLQRNLIHYRQMTEKINRRIGLLGKGQTWLFVAGIVMIAAARAYAGFLVMCVGP